MEGILADHLPDVVDAARASKYQAPRQRNLAGGEQDPAGFRVADDPGPVFIQKLVDLLGGLSGMQRRTGFTSECQEREVNGVAERFNDSPDVPGTER